MLITASTLYIAYALTDEMAAYVALRVRAYKRDGTEVLMQAYTTGEHYVRFDVVPLADGEWMLALEGTTDTYNWQPISITQGVKV